MGAQPGLGSPEQSCNSLASVFIRLFWSIQDTSLAIPSFNRAPSRICIHAYSYGFSTSLTFMYIYYWGKTGAKFVRLRQMDKARLNKFMTTKNKARKIALALPVSVIHWRWVQIDNLLSAFPIARTQKENRRTHICRSQHWRIPQFCCAVHNILKIGVGARHNSNSRKKYF